ncbi:ABC transporter ATP-binding protein [Priestia endophytica]|uniref:ABC-2 type transport system ATP-binding protein n=1 Tax=Priestia endophytica DSM 13796 TaxID=1121089 RepID=A0A1I5ZGQ9_9BACI|nr:ABC transporter ATP-binding protein [Priestia endophytica]KYG29823.1 multidrug ABC transporter ATP-binding protein [Priestia endophytica]SFQ55664.1 ABC-2 type transport system ATP-binding protein [Priestia endophytica DSM 13796]
MEHALEVENLQKSFSNSSFSLKDISFAVPYGSIVGFIGENGAGKTSTMGTILGTLRKDSGYIRAIGEEMSDEKHELKEHIGVVYDSMNFPGNLDMTKLGKVMKHVYKNWNSETYSHYIDVFSLPKKQAIKSFSKGMSMKVSLAVALSHDAKILILDEATAGLDPVAREDILDMFSEFVKDQKRSILLSSHITSDIEKIADQLVFIKKGEIVLRVSTEELLNNYTIVQCEAHDVEAIVEKSISVRKRDNHMVDVLLPYNKELPLQYRKKDFTIDDITLLLMKGDVKREGTLIK